MTPSDLPAPPNAPPARRSAGAQRSPESADAIIAAAADLLAEGAATFTIEAVARRARAGKQTIYRWWPNRAALLIDVYHRQKGVDGIDYSGGTADQIADFIRRIWAFWRDTPAGRGFRLVVAESQTDPAAAAVLDAYFTGRRRDFVAAMGAEADPAAVEAVHELLVGFNLGRLLTGRLEDDPPVIQRVAGALAGMLRDAGHGGA